MLYLVSDNACQYYTVLCIVYRYVGISGIFKSQSGNFIAGAGYTNLPSWKRVVRLCNFNYVKYTSYLRMF